MLHFIKVFIYALYYNGFFFKKLRLKISLGNLIFSLNFTLPDPSFMFKKSFKKRNLNYLNLLR